MDPIAQYHIFKGVRQELETEELFQMKGIDVEISTSPKFLCVSHRGFKAYVTVNNSKKVAFSTSTFIGDKEEDLHEFIGFVGYVKRTILKDSKISKKSKKGNKVGNPFINLLPHSDLLGSPIAKERVTEWSGLVGKPGSLSNICKNSSD